MLVDIDLIFIGDRLRSISPEQVEAIASSIAEVGLLSPITVFRRPIIRHHVSEDGFGLVAGLHRIEACKGLGLTEIEANVVELDDLDRQIAECDENLCGTKLTPSERAVFTRRRKEAYEAKHPETRQGATGRAGYKNDNLSSFSDDTASKTGVDKRTVERDARRGDKIDANVLASIAGTDLDKGVILDSLAAIPKADQAAKLEKIKASPTGPKAEVWAAAAQRSAPLPAIEPALPAEEAVEPHPGDGLGIADFSFTSQGHEALQAVNKRLEQMFETEDWADWAGSQILIPNSFPGIDPDIVDATAQAMALLYRQPRIYVSYEMVVDEHGEEDFPDTVTLVAGQLDLRAFLRAAPGAKVPVIRVLKSWDAKLMTLAEHRQRADITAGERMALRAQWNRAVEEKHVADEAAEAQRKVEEKQRRADRKVWRSEERARLAARKPVGGGK